MAEFLHGCAGGPVSSTFVTAIQNKYFVTWPGLTPDLICKHLPPSRATTKSHLHQEAQGLQSTKTPNLDNENYIKNIRQNIARLKSKMKKDTNLSTLIKIILKLMLSLNHHLQTSKLMMYATSFSLVVRKASAILI